MPSKQISDDSFESDVLQSDKPVLVDFWAEWCGPCKQIGPTLEELSDDKSDALVVAKLNIDDNPMTPSKYGVRGIPTLLLFKDGQVASMKVGSLPKSLRMGRLGPVETGDRDRKIRRPRPTGGVLSFGTAVYPASMPRSAIIFRFRSRISLPASS